MFLLDFKISYPSFFYTAVFTYQLTIPLNCNEWLLFASETLQFVNIWTT